MKIGGHDFSGDDTLVRQQFFKKADTDGDGKISKDELKTVLADRPGPARSGGAGAPGLDDIFSQIDTDGDGSIDDAENDAHMTSMAARHHRAPPDPGKIAERLFKKADQDGDGRISKSELQAALPQDKRLSSSLDAFFKDADSDQDGAISQSDLAASISRQMQQGLAYGKSGEITTSAKTNFVESA